MIITDRFCCLITSHKRSNSEILHTAKTIPHTTYQRSECDANLKEFTLLSQGHQNMKNSGGYSYSFHMQREHEKPRGGRLLIFFKKIESKISF